MNETLFKIHNVDIDAVGLGDFGKRGKLIINTLCDIGKIRRRHSEIPVHVEGKFLKQVETCVSSNGKIKGKVVQFCQLPIKNVCHTFV